MENVKDDEMQRDIAVGKALRLPSVVQRVVSDGSAIDGNENIFTFGSANKAHMVTKPAFEATALVVIGTGALAARRAILRAVVITGFKAVNVEIAHICSDFLKVFDKLAVRGHGSHSFLSV